MGGAPDERQYWRLTSLDEFDGNGWGARSDYADATGPLAGTIDPAAAGAAIVQTVSLSGLGNSYLPVAFEPRRVIDDGGVALEYEAASGSLIKSRSAALSGPSRFTYSAESVVSRDRRSRPAPQRRHVGSRPRLPGLQYATARRCTPGRAR